MGCRRWVEAPLGAAAETLPRALQWTMRLASRGLCLEGSRSRASPPAAQAAAPHQTSWEALPMRATRLAAVLLAATRIIGRSRAWALLSALGHSTRAPAKKGLYLAPQPGSEGAAAQCGATVQHLPAHVEEWAEQLPDKTQSVKCRAIFHRHSGRRPAEAFRRTRQ